MSRLFAPAPARAVRTIINPWVEKVVSKASPRRDRYARDPFALPDEGLVKILDLETHEEATLTLWPHQREVISSWVDLAYLKRVGRPRFRNVHEEKSRQMGLTWVTGYLVAWLLTFHNVRGLALSQKLGEICDSGPTLDSFFGRVKFIYEHFPEDLQVPLIVTGGNDPSIRTAGRTHSFIAGEGATPDAGRGGNYEYVFLDEAARIPWGKLVHTSVSRACPRGRFYNSTPNGEDPLYFWLRDTKPKGYRFLRHHWSLNPVYSRGMHVSAIRPNPETKEPGSLARQPTKEMERLAATCEMCAGSIADIPWDPNDPHSHRYESKLTSPWYEAAVVELTDEQVAQELDIDYSGSLPARVYMEFNEERHVVPEIPFDPTLPIELCWDYGWVMNSVGIFQETPMEYRMIGEFERPDLIPEQVAAGLRSTLRSLGVAAKDLQEFNTLTWLCVGDPAGDAVNLRTGRPLTAEYATLGFNITSRPRPVDQTIIAVKRLLMGRPKLLMLSAATCPNTISHLKNNKWPTDRLGNRKVGATAPENNEHNHMLRAVAYLVTHKFPPPVRTREPIPPPPREETGRVDPGLGYDTDF